MDASRHSGFREGRRAGIMNSLHKSRYPNENNVPVIVGHNFAGHKVVVRRIVLRMHHC